MRPRPRPLNPEIRARNRALLAWYDRTGRDLPWRRTKDRWAILVSEVMLQQTQVVRVESVYR
ncbi:MAG: A/G-specific adenine glycosylase, partial [Acidimicrobiia bacterium]